MRNFHTVFHNDYTNLYSHQQWMSLLFSTTSSTLVIYCFLIKAILTGVKCYLTNILICISWRLVMLRIFLYAYWPSVYLLWKNNVSSIPLPIFVCLMLNCMSSLYILHIIPDQIYHLQMSSVIHLEKEMATHSSILAWKIPWTERPGRLQSMGSQRVRHDWATSLSLSVIH